MSSRGTDLTGRERSLPARQPPGPCLRPPTGPHELGSSVACTARPPVVARGFPATAAAAADGKPAGQANIVVRDLEAGDYNKGTCQVCRECITMCALALVTPASHEPLPA